jgi:hypothetical protein
MSSIHERALAMAVSNASRFSGFIEEFGDGAAGACEDPRERDADEPETPTMKAIDIDNEAEITRLPA